MTTEEYIDAVFDIMRKAEAGTATRADFIDLMELVAKKRAEVCEAEGADSERCINLTDALEQMAPYLEVIPSKRPSTHGTGTVVVVGVLGLVAGAVIAAVAKS